MNSIVFHGRAKWFAVPDADRTARLWFEHHLADGLAHEFCDAPPGTRGYLAKRSKLFFSQVNLSFFHVCQYMTDDDVRQIQAACAWLLTALRRRPFRMNFRDLLIHPRVLCWLPPFGTTTQFTRLVLLNTP